MRIIEFTATLFILIFGAAVAGSAAASFARPKCKRPITRHKPNMVMQDSACCSTFSKSIFHREILVCGQVTLLREHCQGPNAMMFVLPTGGYDARRHGGREACARAELSEEAHLAGGAWEALLPAGHAGLAEVKWSPNRFTPFLCVDPQVHPALPTSASSPEIRPWSAVRRYTGEGKGHRV